MLILLYNNNNDSKLFSINYLHVQDLFYILLAYLRYAINFDMHVFYHSHLLSCFIIEDRIL